MRKKFNLAVLVALVMFGILSYNRAYTLAAQNKAKTVTAPTGIASTDDNKQLAEQKVIIEIFKVQKVQIAALADIRNAVQAYNTVNAQLQALSKQIDGLKLDLLKVRGEDPDKKDINLDTLETIDKPATPPPAPVPAPPAPGAK